MNCNRAHKDKQKAQADHIHKFTANQMESSVVALSLSIQLGSLIN
jgi:hypothetical protein